MTAEWQSVHLPYQLGAHDSRRHSYRIDALIKMAGHAIAGVARPRILDIGCGRGEFVAAAKERLGADVVAIDVDPVCAEFGRLHGTAYCGTLPEIFAEHESELTRSVDLVVSSHSLEHMPDPISGIELMKKISRGHLLLAVPNPHYLPNLVKVLLLNRIPQVNKGHYWCWDVGHFAWFLHGMVGLELVEWGADWVQLLPPKAYRLPGIVPLVRGLEAKLLPRHFPRLAESLIVLCRKPAAA